MSKLASRIINTAVFAAVLVCILSIGEHALAADSYNYKSSCPSPAGGMMWVDPWNFYKCECTSYVADKLNEKGIKFNNAYKGVRWGYAKNWKNAAKSAGFTTNNTPKVGSIAWFSYGHVAFVESVSGTKVTISEYNYYAYKYSTRTIKITSVSSFLHIK